MRVKDRVELQSMPLFDEYSTESTASNSPTSERTSSVAVSAGSICTSSPSPIVAPFEPRGNPARPILTLHSQKFSKCLPLPGKKMFLFRLNQISSKPKSFLKAVMPRMGTP